MIYHYPRCPFFPSSLCLRVCLSDSTTKMLSKTTATLLLALTPGSLAWQWGKSGKWTGAQRTNCHGGETYINYTTVTGFFQQDDSATDASTFDYVSNLLAEIVNAG